MAQVWLITGSARGYGVVASSTRSVLISRLPANKTASFLPSNHIQKER